MLWISDPKALQYVYQTSGYNYPKQPERRVLSRLIGDTGLTWAEGELYLRGTFSWRWVTRALIDFPRRRRAQATAQSDAPRLRLERVKGASPCVQTLRRAGQQGLVYDGLVRPSLLIALQPLTPHLSR